MGQTHAAEALRIDALAKRYPGGGGVEAVSMTVKRGSVTGFIGVNGAGKSTTLRCVLGLLRPDAGAITILGAPADASSRRRIGFLPEERGLFPRDRAREAIGFAARLKGLSRREAMHAADRLLERIGLGDRRRARIGELSKGNAQRVQILCALAHDPDLLILDEPLSGLDPVGQGDILSLLAEFRAGGGAIVFSTHSMAAAEQLSDQVVILARGRTVFEGPLSEVSVEGSHGAVVVTADEAGLFAAVAAIGGAVRPISAGLGDASRWRVTVPPQVTHPVLMRALAEQSVPIFAFEPIRPGLESAFWDLAAPDAEAPRRSRAA
jgi:ABC-2 type transport system ATP-binding protein